MSSAGTDTSQAEIIESDLPSLASRAAIELDNIIIEQEGELKAISRLAENIERSCSGTRATTHPVLLCDPSIAVVLNYAFADSEIVGGKLTTVDELLVQAKEIGSSLRSILADPVGFRQRDLRRLEQMRAFCVALSRRASAYEQSMDDYVRAYPLRG